MLPDLPRDCRNHAGLLLGFTACSPALAKLFPRIFSWWICSSFTFRLGSPRNLLIVNPALSQFSLSFTWESSPGGFLAPLLCPPRHALACELYRAQCRLAAAFHTKIWDPGAPARGSSASQSEATPRSERTSQDRSDSLSVESLGMKIGHAPNPQSKSVAIGQIWRSTQVESYFWGAHFARQMGVPTFLDPGFLLLRTRTVCMDWACWHWRRSRAQRQSAQ